MKTLKIIIVALLSVVLGSNSYAHMTDHSKKNKSNIKTDSKLDMTSSKPESVKVWGNCDMCKTRIEKAAKIRRCYKSKLGFKHQNAFFSL